ncbi:Calcium-transporting ATPase 5, plasma membrane-type [Asimina triloba]
MVRMVTGDNIQTAKAIALECGILDSEAAATYPTVIEGRVFRALSDFQREEVADSISVWTLAFINLIFLVLGRSVASWVSQDQIEANPNTSKFIYIKMTQKGQWLAVMGRSSPNDKLLLVQALRKKGHVVAVTGDGTNDAPALHEADIGLAMGIQGTEVAKESSDIIILDDNFASVVKVVRWGRSVYANIQKFIQFQLTVNVAALVINVVAAFSSGNVPLNAVQLLWVNLIMDTLGALALATEPPTDHLMLRPPALYQVVVLLVLNFRGKDILHLNDTSVRANRVKNTVIFNAFVLCQIFNEFNARKPDEMNVFSGITKNHLFVGIVGITVVLQVLIIEFIGKFTKTVRLNWKFWLASIAIAFISAEVAAMKQLMVKGMGCRKLPHTECSTVQMVDAKKHTLVLVTWIELGLESNSMLADGP